MNNHQWIACLLSAFLLSACGGGNADNNSDWTNPGGGSTDNGSTDNPHYTGEQALAHLNTTNAADFLAMLYEPGFNTPDLAFRSIQNISLANSDFLRSQSDLLEQVQDMFMPDGYIPSTVNLSRECNNDGTLSLQGSIQQSTSIATANVTWNRCELRGYTFNGVSNLKVTGTDNTFTNLSSSTLTLNNLAITLETTADAFLANGVLTETHDLNAGTAELTVELHREMLYSSKENLVEMNEAYTNLDDSIQANGVLYHGTYGRADVKTMQPLVYNADDTPVTGTLMLEGADNSKIKITTLGGQYSTELDREQILIQVEVDADGDGIFEDNSQVSADTIIDGRI